MAEGKSDWVNIDIREPHNVQQFGRDMNHYCSGKNKTLFDYLYYLMAEVKTTPAEVMKDFHDWWFYQKLDTRLNHLRDGYVIPKSKSQYTKKDKANFAKENKEDIIAEVLYAVMIEECTRICMSENCEDLLSVPLYELVRKVQKIHTGKHAARQADLGLRRHTVSALVLSMLAYHDVEHRNRHLKTLEEFNREISGHERTIFLRLGAVIIGLGSMLAIAILISALPVMQPFIAFGSDYLLQFYICASTVAYISITGGVALLQMGLPSDLADYSRRVCLSITPTLKNNQIKGREYTKVEVLYEPEGGMEKLLLDRGM